MDFHMKLPRSKKEFALFIAVISIISVNIIAPLITCFEAGFHMYIYKDVLSVLPYIWLTVVAVVLITYVPAEWLTHRIVREGDSFNSVMAVNILCTVLMMSPILTVLGTWIGTRTISMTPIVRFFHIWPRNFAISMGVEMLIAQPIARFVMKKLHEHTDGKAASRAAH